MKAYRHFIFDFDGTLADSSTLAIGLLNELAQIFHFKELKDKNEAQKLRELSSREGIKYLGIPRYKIPLIVWKARKLMNKRMTKLKLAHPDIAETLQQLKREGATLGILSTNSEKNIKLFLEYQNFPSFDFIHQSSLFGKHQRLKKIIKSYKLENRECLYIGDEVRDIVASKKALIDSIAVTWGHNTEQSLLKNGPNYLIKSPDELFNYLKNRS